MMKCYGTVCAVTLLLGICTSGVAEDLTPEMRSGDLDRVRQDAMDLIQDGQRLDAARLLLESLREFPKDRPDLAVPGIGVIQLLLFSTEYILTPDEAGTLYGETLDGATSDIDKFVATLIRYTDDRGMNQEQANQTALDLYELTNCEHQAVQLGALFIMSDPYYFHDTPLAFEARDRINERYPGHYLAREANRLPLYFARNKGVETLLAIFGPREGSELEQVPVRHVLADPVARNLKEIVGLQLSASDRDSACVARLVESASTSGDWPDEYAALNLLDGLDQYPEHRSTIRAAATAAIERDTDPRSVFRARTLRMSIGRKAGDKEQLKHDAEALLATISVPIVPERNNYEEQRNTILQTADTLAELGEVESARELLERFAAGFPGSALAVDVEGRLSDLPTVTKR